MIKNIIFDFGDVFINLDKEVIFREIVTFGGAEQINPEIFLLNERYEVGAITSDEFIMRLGIFYPNAKPGEIIALWNAMLLDFPEYRLKFIENFAQENTYRLFLLSNTNSLHIAQVATKMGAQNYLRFKNVFEKFYLSHEIKLRKPSTEIFEFVLHQNKLIAEETFFIDDTKEHTNAAKKLGIHTWNLGVGQEDIIHLKSKLP